MLEGLGGNHCWRRAWSNASLSQEALRGGHVTFSEDCFVQAGKIPTKPDITVWFGDDHQTGTPFCRLVNTTDDALRPERLKRLDHLGLQRQGNTVRCGQGVRLCIVTELDSMRHTKGTDTRE